MITDEKLNGVAMTQLKSDFKEVRNKNTIISEGQKNVSFNTYFMYSFFKIIYVNALKYVYYLIFYYPDKYYLFL